MAARRALARGLAACIAAAGAVAPLTAQASSAARTSVEVELPAAQSLLTPYIDLGGATLLVHLQAREGSGDERLVDARTGARWQGDAQRVAAEFTRLAVDTPRDALAGRAWDQRLLTRLGCQTPVLYCSSPADADVVLLVTRLSAQRVRLETVDLRALLRRMDELMAGRIDAAEVARDDSDWALLELAAASPAHRQRWREALRSIDSAARWQRLAEAAQRGPRLVHWAALRTTNETPSSVADEPLDLAGELERQGLRLQVSRLAAAVAEVPTIAAASERLRALADALLLGTQPGFRGDMPSALVDVLVHLDAPSRQRIASGLALEAAQRRSRGLWCYAQWTLAEPCAGAPPWDQASAAAPSNAPPAPPAATAPPTSPAPPSPASAAAAPLRNVAAPSSSDAPLEWALIQAQPSQLPLLAFDETSGRLAAETGAAAGLSFVARALGPLQDGRFELQVAPNARAPLALRYGAYRVKVRLVLDYAREDRCRSGLLCLFASADRHARTERRDLVFALDPDNRFIAHQRADFGALLPLAVDGSMRYASRLTQARLAVESVRFELR